MSTEPTAQDNYDVHLAAANVTEKTLRAALVASESEVARLREELDNASLAHSSQADETLKAIAGWAKATKERDAAIARAEAAVETEQQRWQDRLDELFRIHVPDAQIDGGGCDSGDPLDFSASEISQAFQHLEARAEAAEADLKVHREFAGREIFHSDFQTAGDMRKALDAAQSEVARLRAELAEAKRYLDLYQASDHLVTKTHDSIEKERDAAIARAEAAERELNQVRDSRSRVIVEQDAKLAATEAERDALRRRVADLELLLVTSGVPIPATEEKQP